MERWMGSRSARWGIVLGTGLLLLLVSLTKFRAGFEEVEGTPPKPPAAAKSKREALRYGGKNFDQWRVEMETELKPEVRADGMTAMAAFGANGYAVEATRTIVELMAGYEVDTSNTKDKAVVEAAAEAVRKIGKPALRILWEGVRNENERSRLFAIAVLPVCLQVSEPDWRPPVAELLKAAGHEDKHVREMALILLEEVKNKPKSCLPVLLECLNDNEPNVREKSINCLDKMQPEARAVMSALRTAIGDSELRVRYGALIMAGHYGAQAKPILPALLKRLEKPEALPRGIGLGVNIDEFAVFMGTLAAIGPAAKEALPRLRELRDAIKEPAGAVSYSRGSSRTDREILDLTIEKIEGK